jgi:asparagine synthase (glutamine-hydrolysing)
MPGLFGIVAKTPEVSRAELHSLGRRMCDAMRVLPWLRAELFTAEHFCGGRVHAGVLNPQAQPLATVDGCARVWLDGECRMPHASGGAPSADALRALVIGTPPAIVAADGAFALAVLEADGQLVLATDRLGFRPLYFTETRDWFAYAAEVKALLAIQARVPPIDELAVRQYFAFDHMLGDRTWWCGINLIPPAALWHIAGSDSRRQQYWTFDRLRRERCDPAEGQEEFGRLWAQAVREHRRPGTTPVLLSGGLDSRLLIAELLAQDADIVAVTYGSRHSPEVGPARAVARVGGFDHRVCEWTTRNWWQGRERAIWQTDGLVNANHLHPAIAMEEMRVGTCYSPMNMLGDLLFGGSHLERTPWSELQMHPERLMERRFVANPFVQLEEALEVAKPDIQRDPAGPSSDCVHLRQRVRRYVLHSPGCFGPYCETVFPGSGLDFLQLFLGSLSDDDRRGHKFYNAFLASRHPKFFANLPWQPTGRGLRESTHVRITRDLRRRLQRALRQSRRKTPANQWFVDYPAAVREHRVRERLLAQQLLVDDVLRGAARRALQNDHERPVPAESVIAILTLETYLRQVAAMPRLTMDSGAQVPADVFRTIRDVGRRRVEPEPASADAATEPIAAGEPRRGIDR